MPLAVQMPPQAAAALGPGAHPMRLRITLLADAAAHAAGDDSVQAQRSEKSTFVIPR